MHSMFLRALGAVFCCVWFMGAATTPSAGTVIPDIKPDMRQTPTPNWVVQQSYDPKGLTGVATDGPAYLLVSSQRWHETDSEIYYSRQVKRLDDTESLQDASQLSFGFDPSFERLELHHIRIIRNGETSDRLDMDGFRVLHNETDASRLIYNGQVTASMILQDVRQGDIIDYAYSVHGKNPAFHGHISDVTSLRYGVPIARNYRQINLPADRDYSTRDYATAPKPQVITEAGRTIYTWSETDVPGIDGHDNVPNWYTDFAYFEVSDMPSWSELGAFYSSYYVHDEPLSDELKAEIERIRNDHSDDKARTEAALDFVQRHIRYLGIEMGKGGYAPRSPSQVMAQRFGDCKDKTVLLIAMLKEMGISAQPLLVDTDNFQHFERRLPSGYAFDHVITKVTLDGSVYWLDPTNLPQFGSLDHLEQGDFGAGLTIAGEKSAIEKHPSQSSGELVEAKVTEIFDLTAENKTAVLTVETVLRRGRADSFLRDIRNSGQAQIQKDYLEFYQKTYSSIEPLEDMVIVEDEVAGTVTITEAYEIPNSWTKRKDNSAEEFTAWPYEVRSLLTDMDTVKRTAPYAVSGPGYGHHIIKFKLAGDWNLEATEKTINNDHFTLSKTSDFTDQVFTQNYIIRTKSRAVPAGEHVAMAKAYEEAYEISGVELFRPLVTESTAAAEATETEPSTLTMVLSISGAIAFIAFCVFAFVKAIKLDEDHRHEAIYYPVSTAKFLIMSIGTFSLYLFYWTYKNWQWVRDVDNQPNSPFWRSFFSWVMNFSLFPRIATHRGHDNTWLAGAAGILAFVFFLVTIFGRISDEWLGIESMPMILVSAIAPILVPVLLTLPFVRHISKMNADNDSAIALNSSYSWHSVVALVSFVTLFALIVYGS